MESTSIWHKGPKERINNVRIPYDLLLYEKKQPNRVKYLMKKKSRNLAPYPIKQAK